MRECGEKEFISTLGALEHHAMKDNSYNIINHLLHI